MLQVAVLADFESINRVVLPFLKGLPQVTGEVPEVSLDG